MAANDYSRPERKPFPRELAALIARKADAIARRFEDQATRQLVRSAQNALDRGATVAEIAKQLELH
ncbi:hypothetical protein IR009_12395 [Pseudomonas putida]|uniref:hypothetical protein n=1 Tax=Pseudomonas putida TaxID=303 RepID=UPI0018A8B538|nr:hypothetical protein [Pseudomonas putida]MBF8766023.1 hypothetical protein [Pseudomonas putida]